jgi:hypothetical protein
MTFAEGTMAGITRSQVPKCSRFIRAGTTAASSV